jgi:hypothetical protein
MVGAILLAALMLLVLPAGQVGASASPSGTAPQTIWAYGAVRTLDFHGNAHNGWEYDGNATYGYSVILNQTNTSATSFDLNVNRTMGALFQVHYCFPRCQAGIYFGNVSAHVYETVAASANFTTVGRVNENGTAVVAIALDNSESRMLANVTERASSYLPGDLGQAAPRSAYLGAQIAASSSVTFTPGLGILPIDLSSAQEWNSSAGFAAQASASYAWYANVTGPHGSVQHGPNTGNLSVPLHGNVSLSGSYSPSNTVVLGGVAYPEISLKVVGPFVVREGFLLVPSIVDLFGGTSVPWGQQNSSATAAMSYLDARSSEGGHFGVGASQWVYDSSTAGPGAAVSGWTGVAEVSPNGATGPDSAPPTTVQGGPETVGSAQSQQTCLLTGSGCPSGGGPGGPTLRGLAGLLGLGVVVIVVVAVIVLVAERRRMPPPVYPNAALYPPGASRPGAKGSPPPNPAPPVEEDPLRNLW